MKAPDLGAGLRAELRVEVGQRLVHEEDLGLAHERAAEGDALALSARELTRLAVEQRRDIERACRFVDTAADLVPLELPDLQAERQVLPHAHLGVERVVLEHHCDVALARRDVVDDAVADANAP